MFPGGGAPRLPWVDCTRREAGESWLDQMLDTRKFREGRGGEGRSSNISNKTAEVYIQVTATWDRAARENT